MRLTLAAVGRLKTSPEADLIDDYATRIRATGRPLGVTAFTITEVEAPKGLEGARRRERESAQLLEATSRASRRIVLDEKGRLLTSAEFAALIGRWIEDGAEEIAFFIGGADGHGEALVAAADLSVAFGKATFPHMLVRVMLVEQIYRAMTILAGHPYHRA